MAGVTNELIASAKLARRITTTAYDSEVRRLLETAMLDMGVAGAAIATLISQCISFCLLLVPVLLKKNIAKLSISNFSRNLSFHGNIWFTGLPSLLRQGLASISTIFLNLQGGGLAGDAALSAMGIFSKVTMLIFCVLLGIGQGYQPVLGFNYGAKKYGRLRKAFSFTFRTGMIILGTLGILGMIAPQAVVHLFRDDPRVVEIGALALRFQCVAVFFQSFSVTANMMFQSVGRSREASFLATLRSGLFYIPLLIILPRFMGLMGIQSAQMWSDILTTAVCLPFVIRFFREIPKEDQEAAIDIAYRRTTGK